MGGMTIKRASGSKGMRARGRLRGPTEDRGIGRKGPISVKQINLAHK